MQSIIFKAHYTECSQSVNQNYFTLDFEDSSIATKSIKNIWINCKHNAQISGGFKNGTLYKSTCLDWKALIFQLLIKFA